MRALFIALVMLPLSAAQASPIYYNAIFDIDSLHGAAPADWGTVTLGTSVNLQFTWDSELAVQQTSTIWSPGPLTSYVMNVGDATIQGAASVSASRMAGSTSIFIDDFQPVVCTPPAPCAGGFGDWFVDDVFFNFQCADWSGAPGLLENVSCASGLSGTTFFELFQSPQQQDFGISASLTGIKRSEVPEPSGLALVAVGLAGMWFARRKTTLRKPVSSGAPGRS